MSGEPRIFRDYVIDGKTFALVVQTSHGDTVATTAVHQQNYERRIGGVRCVLPPKNGGAADALTEVGNLSSTMTEKCMAAMIPADGQKSVVVTTPDVMADNQKKVAVLAEHERVVASLDPGVIFGPDMAVPEAVQDALSQQQGLFDHVTGLSSRNRGLSIDDNGYTGIGVAEAIQTVYPAAELEGRLVSIQGFGAVGAHTAKLLARAGARVVAVSNEYGMLVAEGGGALDVPKIFAEWTSKGDDWIRAFPASGVRFVPDTNALFGVPVDIFIPAARTSVLATTEEIDEVGDENPDVQAVERFFERSGVKVVAQGANHPLSAAAEAFLERNGVIVLPDFIINCGGLIGCWEEWEARHAGQGDRVAERAEAAQARVRQTVRRNVERLRQSGLPAREAAARIVQDNRERLTSSCVGIDTE